MNKNKIVGGILGILFIGISLNYFKNYLAFKSCISNNSTPISYFFIDKRINEGGRGEIYEMDYKFNNQKGSISITSKEYNLIEKGNYPQLYYCENSHLIFSKWEITKAFRIAILFFLLFIVIVAYQIWVWRIKENPMRSRR